MTRRRSTARHWPWIATLRRPSRDSRGSSRRSPVRHSQPRCRRVSAPWRLATWTRRMRHLNAQVGSAPAPPRCRTASRRWHARGAMQVSRRTSRRLSAPSGRSAGRLALEAYRQALAIDPNLLAAQEGAERAEPRAAIEAQLNGYAARPERLFSTEVRAAARAALPPGPFDQPRRARAARSDRQSQQHWWSLRKCQSPSPSAPTTRQTLRSTASGGLACSIARTWSYCPGATRSSERVQGSGTCGAR